MIPEGVSYKQKASSLCSGDFFIGLAHSSKLDAQTNKKASTYVEAFCLSGGQDSNLRPLGPKPSILPS